MRPPSGIFAPEIRERGSRAAEVSVHEEPRRLEELELRVALAEDGAGDEAATIEAEHVAVP
jgi:hypothetical protein